MIKRAAFVPVPKELVTKPIEEAAAKLAKLARPDGTVDFKALKEAAAESTGATKEILDSIATRFTAYPEYAINMHHIVEPAQLSPEQALAAQRSLAAAQTRLGDIMGVDQKLEVGEMAKIVPPRTDVQNGDLYDIALAAARAAANGAKKLE